MEQAVVAMTHAVHLGHWQAPLRLAEWHHQGAQGLQVSRPLVHRKVGIMRGALGWQLQTHRCRDWPPSAGRGQL